MELTGNNSYMVSEEPLATPFRHQKGAQWYETISGPNVSFDSICNHIQTTIDTHKLMGVALRIQPEGEADEENEVQVPWNKSTFLEWDNSDFEYVDDWGDATECDYGFFWVRQYPSMILSNCYANVWGATLFVTRAQRHTESTYTYSILSLMPFASSLDPDDRLVTNSLRHAFYQSYMPVKAFAMVNGCDCQGKQVQAVVALDRQTTESTAEVIVDHGKRADIGKLSVKYNRQFDWLCAAHGRTDTCLHEATKSIDALRVSSSHRHSKKQQPLDVNKTIEEKLTTSFNETAALVLGIDDPEQVTHMQWACRAAQLVISPQIALLQFIPSIKQCLPSCLRERDRLPLVLSMCMHLALNCDMYGVSVNVSIHHAKTLFEELRHRVGVVNVIGNLPLDVLIARLIREEARDEKGVPLSKNKQRLSASGATVDECGMLPHASVQLAQDFERLSMQTKRHIRECANVGHYLINTYYTPRFGGFSKVEHDARVAAESDMPIPMMISQSRVYDEMHAQLNSDHQRASKEMRGKTHMPPWPFALIPNNRMHRMIMEDLLMTSNKYARDILQRSYSEWDSQISVGENGFDMMRSLLKNGWDSFELTELHGFLVSPNNTSTCCKCDQSLHSFEFALPIANAHCSMCSSRVCYNCAFKTTDVSNNLCSKCSTCVIGGAWKEMAIPDWGAQE
jgi:hypothetical protein